MRLSSQILIDQSHRQAWSVDQDVASKMNPVNPKDAGYARFVSVVEEMGHEVLVNHENLFSADLLAGVGVAVLPHAALDKWEKTIGRGSPELGKSELDSLEIFVANGGALLVLGETEQDKYGNNFNELVARFGAVVTNETVQDPEHSYKGVPTWPMAALPKLATSDLLFQVTGVCLYRSATLEITEGTLAEIFLRSSLSASPADAPMGVAIKHKKGRVVVIADSDVFGDDSVEDLDNEQLLKNVIGWLVNSQQAIADVGAKATKWPEDDSAWQSLSQAIEELRPLQQKDGSILDAGENLEVAARLLPIVISSIQALAPRFAHQSRYLKSCISDLERWQSSGFLVPDFYDSLELYRPDQHRTNLLENLAVFSMYTQNGNPNRNLEAVITKTFWPDWLAKIETRYQNPSFIPIEFVAFTKGYDTNCATLFPETVAVREVNTYYWGGIFCDREAARFRRVSRSAQELLHIPLPPDAEALVLNQDLAKETYVLWDLIHDRTHSKGDLPFDPFMIKQRMPFWMYALEELRCDLSTFRESITLENEGDNRAKFVRYAILFDRLFRFPITGNRVRNYDGLGGQIVFAHLHQSGALSWTDNRLSFDWKLINSSVVELCQAVEGLYRDGINRSRQSQWIAAYEFVAGLVPPHPASNWSKGADSLPTGGELKEMVNLVLDDEFPLNVFYETLNRNLREVIDSTAGITS
jgi:hypothetical protein